MRCRALRTPTLRAHPGRDSGAAGRRRRKSLNSTERRAYREFRQSLISEWSRVEGIPKKKAETRLRKFLGMSRKKAKGEPTAAIDPLGNKK